MRVQNGAVDSSYASATTKSVQNQADSRLSTTSAYASSSDRVQLSSASSLVALAKGMMPSDKQAKLDAVSAQFSSGSYHADAHEVGQAVVQGHIAA